jgi:Lhr-like helicase
MPAQLGVTSVVLRIGRSGRRIHIHSPHPIISVHVILDVTHKNLY